MLGEQALSRKRITPSSGLRHTLYASGNFAKNTLWGTTEIAFLFIMTEMLDIRPALAGAIIFCSLILDALLAPVVGWACHRLQAPRLGRYGTAILPGAPLAGLTFALLYALPWLGLKGPLAATFLLLAFRAAYALIDLPHNALLETVTQHSPQRARLSLLRFLFSTLATLVVAMALGSLGADTMQGTFKPERLATYGAVIGLSAAAVMIVSWAAVADKDRAASISSPAPHSWRDTWQACLACSSYRVTLLAGAAASLTLPLFSKSLLYLAGSVWNRPELASAMLITMIAGQVFGIALWTSVCKHWSTRLTLAAAHCVTALGCGAILLARPSDWWVGQGAALLIGVGAAGVFALIWNLVADACKEVTDQTSIQVGGVAFSMAILSQKAGIGIGAAGFGLALDLAGYGLGRPASSSTQVVISTAGLVIPAAGSILTALLLLATHNSRGGYWPGLQASASRACQALSARSFMCQHRESAPCRTRGNR